MRKPFSAALFLSLALAASAGTAPAAAATLAGVTLPDQLEVSGKLLVLNGLGLRKKLFIKVYVGGLYLPSKESSAARIAADDGVRRMVLHFLFSVSKSQMCDAWQEGLEGNTPNASPEQKANFTALCNAMEDIPSGSELVLTYTPGKGTLVEIADKLKATLPGKATSDAILATWIGSNPAPGEDFKKAVLGAAGH
jgi:hypothetical protein